MSKLNPTFVDDKYNYYYELIYFLYQSAINSRLIKKGDPESLDFALHCWSYIIYCVNNNVKKIKAGEAWDSYVNAKARKIQYLKRGFHPAEGNLNELYYDISQCVINFATQQNCSFDTLVELGGGSGHNLAKANMLFNQKTTNKKTYINAERSVKGLSLSKRIFSDFGMKNAYSIPFDYYNSNDCIEALKPFVKDKNVIIYSAQSMEQIPNIERSFFETIEKLAAMSNSLSISFCEPIAWQLEGFLTDQIEKNSREMTDFTGLNRNLFAAVKEWLAWSEQGMVINAIEPSIYWNGFHVSGINIKKLPQGRSYLWEKRTKTDI